MRTDHNNGNTMDVRDVIARVEELEGERDSAVPDAEAWAASEVDDAAELAQLTELLSDLAGAGGDEQWRGEWYPVTLVADHYFQQHAKELADDCGMVPADVGWPLTCIDWAQAARELQQDYSSVTFDGGEWWYR